MYGPLPQAGILANQLLVKRLALFGYAPVTHAYGTTSIALSSFPLSWTILV
jgi:hypothetical protein